MGNRRRKVTEALLAESALLARAIEMQVSVLSLRHPGSMPLAIMAQQLAALRTDLEKPATGERK